MFFFSLINFIFDILIIQKRTLVTIKIETKKNKEVICMSVLVNVQQNVNKYNTEKFLFQTLLNLHLESIMSVGIYRFRWQMNGKHVIGLLLLKITDSY
jgi:hypothetical protein